MTVQSNLEWLSDSTGTYRYFAKPIQKSPQDDREYRIIRLQNGLEAMIVHDAKADKAAASLDVAVGHLHDPVSGKFASLLLFDSILRGGIVWYLNPHYSRYCTHSQRNAARFMLYG